MRLVKVVPKAASAYGGQLKTANMRGQKTEKNVDVLNERPLWQICLNGGMPAFRCFRVSDNSVKKNEKPVNIDFFVPANYTIFEFNEAN